MFFYGKYVSEALPGHITPVLLSRPELRTRGLGLQQTQGPPS